MFLYNYNHKGIFFTCVSKQAVRRFQKRDTVHWFLRSFLHFLAVNVVFLGSSYRSQHYWYPPWFLFAEDTKKQNLRIEATVPKYWPLTKDKTLALCLCKNHLRKRAKNLGEERHLDVRTRLPQSACFELSQLSPSFKKEKWEEKLSFFFRASRMVVKQSSNIKKKYNSIKIWKYAYE